MNELNSSFIIHHSSLISFLSAALLILLQILLRIDRLDRIEDAIEWADALNILRLQLERMQGGYIPSLREYNRVFGVSRERLERADLDRRRRCR